MDGILEFMRVFGVLVVCALAVIAAAVFMTACAIRMKRMEARMAQMEEFIRNALSGAQSENRADNLKQRRILSENMANFSESMTRAILSLGDDAPEEEQQNKG